MDYATNRQDQVSNINFSLQRLSKVPFYFVIQLLSEPGKQNVACLFKRQLVLILSRYKIKNAFKCTLKEF